MKIWFPAITGSSGTDIFTSRLAKALQHRGMDVEISWFSTHYQFFPWLLKRAAAPTGTAIIHVNSWNGFAFKRTRIPLVVTEHQGVFGTRYRPYRNRWQALYHLTIIRAYVQASLRAASAVTAVSHYAADGLKRTLGYGSAQPIYNFVDCETFAPAARPREEGPFKLLFVGNWSYLKGSGVLTMIMRRLGSKFELRFTSGLKDLSATDTPDNMVSLGMLTRQEDLVSEYQNCDAVIVPSFFEGFGYVALEAMACGKPVIASNTSAIPEVIDNGISGILCKSGDIDSFITACRHLAANPDVARRYGDAGRRRALAIFSEDVVVPQYIALYERLLGGHG